MRIVLTENCTVDGVIEAGDWFDVADQDEEVGIAFLRYARG